MYTSVNKDVKSIKNKFVKRSVMYFCISMFCAVFGGIYEIFSHGVYSNYMMYAFLFPLIGGTLYNFILYSLRLRLQRGLSLIFYNTGIAALTIGSIVRGILDIYGTDNILANVYRYAGVVFVFLGIVFYAVDRRGNINNSHKCLSSNN